MSSFKLADLSQLSVTELRDLRRAKRERAGEDRPAPLQAVRRPEHIPLSFAQERLWFVDQLGLAETAYNLPAALRLKGALDVAALKASLGELVRRHESLRTRFGLVDGKGVQLVDAPGSFEVEVEDLSDLAEETRDAELMRCVDEEAMRAFDLATGPLFRARLVKRGPRDHSLLVTMHHIVSDGWSLSVMMRELSALYPAFERGDPSPLPEPELQYADYALWQRGWLQGDALERQLGYWRTALSGAPASIDLPTDRPRPKVASFRGSVAPFGVPKELAHALTELARREGATLFMVLLAAFQTVLSRWSGQEDVVVGSPIAGRTHRQTEGLVGFFVNTLALRTDLSGDPTFAELVGRVRETTLGAYAHQELPLEKLVAELSPARDLSRQPLFQAMLVLQNAPGAALRLGELELSVQEIEHRSAKFDLTLFVAETAHGLRGSLEYATDLFDAATIDRFAAHLARVLEQVVEVGERRIGDLELLPDAERRQLLAAGAVRTIAFAEDRCIHHLFAAQAARTPDAVAVMHEGAMLTYGELDRRSNRLAHHLSALGVGPDIVVGLCVERSLEMIVGLLGILKAGGAYLPLDPDYPTERLAYMLDDSRAPVLVTLASLEHRLPPRDDLTLVRLDTARSAIAERPDTLPDTDIRPDALAYVIYTSGSTGQPKGVLIEHRNVTRLFTSARTQIDFGSEDVWTLYHSFSFDFSVWEIFGAVLHGGRLVIVPFETSRSPMAFAGFLNEHRVTILNQTPTSFYNLVPQIEAEPTRAHLRYVIFGGEALDTSRLKFWFTDLGEPAQLVNMYGITETTVHVTVKFLSQDDVAQNSRGIGWPLPDLCAYVLDPRGRLAPVGVFGDLHVGGAGVARGYLDEPELTAERFPTCSIGGEQVRLYRTGDRARWLASGELEYGGRLDAQVKVRGFRIEPGEVESALRDCRGIADAIVATEQDTGSTVRLIAYLVADGSQHALSANDIHAQLSDRLPTHMIPSDFRKIEQIRLTSNGKLDRSCVNGAEALHREAERVEPSSPLEKTILSLFEDVLETTGLGVLDNFFAVGGDSIRMIQLVHRLNEAGHAVGVGDVFQSQSVRGLAAVLATRSPKAADARPAIPLELIDVALAAAGAIPPADAVDLYPATEMQRLMVERSVEMGRGVYRPQHLLAVVDPDFSTETFIAAFNEIGSRQPPLRTRFVEDSTGALLQYVKRDDPVAIGHHDVSGLADADRDAFVEERLRSRTRDPFSLDADGPLMKLDAFHGAGGVDRLAITSHHAVEDGWGFVEFMRELEQTYYRLASDGSGQGPPKPNCLKEHVALQLEAEGNATAREWWQAQLDRPPMPLERQADLARDDVAHIIAIPADELGQIRRKSAAHGITLKTAFLAACMKAVGDALDRDEAIVDVVTNGRSPRLTDPFKSFGLFWTFLPVAATVAELLDADGLTRLQSTLAKGEELNLFPVGKLLREKGLRDMTCAAFNYVNFHNADPRSGTPRLLNFLGGRDRFHHPLKFTVSMAPDLSAARVMIEVRPGDGDAGLADRLMGRTRAALATLG